MMRLKRSIEYTALALAFFAGAYVGITYVVPLVQSREAERKAQIQSFENFSTEFQNGLEGRTK